MVTQKVRGVVPGEESPREITFAVLENIGLMPDDHAACRDFDSSRKQKNVSVADDPVEREKYIRYMCIVYTSIPSNFDR